MRLTREVISNAITLGTEILPRLSIIELAQILGIPLSVMARCVKANQKFFSFTSDKFVLPLKHDSALQMNSGEIWSWYVKNKLNGDEKACFPVQSDQRLSVGAAKVKIEKPFNFAICTFLSLDKTGGEAVEKVKSINAELIPRVVRLARVDGSGQVADRFVFGIILTEAEVAARVCAGLPLYQADWAFEMMMEKSEWVTIGDIPLANPRWVDADDKDPFSDPEFLAHEKEQDKEVLKRSNEEMTDSAVAASESLQAQKKGRRTNEQIKVERKRMFDEVVAGGFAEEVAKPILELEKFVEAEKVYKMMLKSLGETPPTPTIPGQQVMTEVADMKSPAEKLVEKRIGMTTLSDLEKSEETMKPTIQDLKTDIRTRAGGVAPVAIEAPKPAPTVLPSSVAVTPTVTSTPALPQSSPASSGQQSAEDLLNGLLTRIGG